MSKLNTPLLIACAALLALGWPSCESYQKVLKSDDLDYKYEKALEYYHDGDYDKAVPLLEEMITIYKGAKSVESLYYYYANSQYMLESYLVAAYHFKNFYNAYPQGEWAEESLFKHALCYYHVSPRVPLDQTYTRKALDAIQLFINTFPESDKVAKCNNYMDELYRKLELKAFNSAMLYFQTAHYKAAATSFKNLLSDFPGTIDAEKAAFYIVKSYYLYAQNSLRSWQKERYQQAVQAYFEFIDRYRDSKYAREAENIYESALSNLEKLKENG